MLKLLMTKKTIKHSRINTTFRTARSFLKKIYILKAGAGENLWKISVRMDETGKIQLIKQADPLIITRGICLF